MKLQLNTAEMPEGYTICDNRILNSKELTADAKYLYIWLISKPTNFRFFGAENIARLSGLGIRPTRNALKELETHGLLKFSLAYNGKDKNHFGRELLIEFFDYSHFVNNQNVNNQNVNNQNVNNQNVNKQFDYLQNAQHNNKRDIQIKENLESKENLENKENLEIKESDKGESEKSLSAKSPELENELSKPKSKFAKLSAKESIAYVTELYNQLEVKPKGDFETFCEWLKCKAGKKGLLEYVAKRDFECYQRLDLLTAESPNDRLNRALQGNQKGVYQSLIFKGDDFTGGGYRGVELKHNAKNVNDNFSVTQTQRDLFAKPKYSFSSDKIAKFDNRQKIADGGEKC